jgi:hypothetical protein
VLPEGSPPLPKQTYANVRAVKNGNALLRDPDGYGLMWREKVRFYEHEPSEAIAQAQKGIREHFEIRNGVPGKSGGYKHMNVRNAAGMTEVISLKVPDIPPKIRSMMDLILESPVGIDATEAAVAKLTQQLKRLGARDLQSALQEAVGSVSALKTVKLPKGYSLLQP